MNKKITVALIANPNTGKTSLLNSLAGMSLHVGNWPGKTVEKKQGLIKHKEQDILIVDLPGTYSILPYSNEEKIARDFLLEENPDVIVQVIDVNSLERNLLLTFELLDFEKKIILAFNFNKEARQKGLKIDIEKISEKLELPIVAIEANTGENKAELADKILEVYNSKYHKPACLKEIRKGRKGISHRAGLDFIEKELSPFYRSSDKDERSFILDSWLLNKYLALPFFFLVIYSLFKITFILSMPMVAMIDNLFKVLAELIRNSALSDFWTSLLVEGVVGGVGSVLSFTPIIFVLFFLITILEDSGYLSRTVIILDKIFHRFGISGQTFLPMILGFGCNVPAIMATRTIQHKKERLIAIFINSFMSCSGRLPIYVLFAGIFFPNRAATVIMILYLIGVFVALIASWFLSKMIKIEGENAMIIELPPYRWPSMKNVFKHAWWQMSMFIRKAGTIIFVAVIIIWLLANFPQGVDYGSAESYLGQFGSFIAPVFKPLGFGHWTFATALVFGLVAKEIIIGTLGTLHGVSAVGLSSTLPGMMDPLGAFSFMVFVLLYIPCLPAVAMIKKETNSWEYTFLHALSVSLVAWLVAFMVYQIGLMF